MGTAGYKHLHIIKNISTQVLLHTLCNSTLGRSPSALDFCSPFPCNIQSQFPCNIRSPFFKKYLSLFPLEYWLPFPSESKLENDTVQCLQLLCCPRPSAGGSPSVCFAGRVDNENHMSGPSSNYHHSHLITINFFSASLF